MARCIVDEDERRALRPAILEPPMLATVDLHQLANAVTPVTRLINALQTLLAVEPQSVRDHPLASRLAAKNEPMQLTQLLGRQGRAKIPVALADDRQRPREAPRACDDCSNDRAAPAAATVASRPQSKSGSTSSRVTSRSLISRTVTPTPPEKSPGECYFYLAEG